MSRNIALVGCGAIGQMFYLPALANLRGEFDRIWLIDPSEHGRAAACSIVQGEAVPSLAQLDGDVQFVIIAAPNALHFALAQEALSRNAHVLIEKPFAIWPAEGRQLTERATCDNRILAVNQTRRLFPGIQELRKRISAGEYGALVSVVHSEGTKLTWPFESGAAFAKNAQRTGVIMDLGVHVIDLYQYLLQPEWTFVSGTHDGFCGPEGLAKVELKADNSLVALELSRYRSQKNTARLKFEHAEVLINVHDWNSYLVQYPSGTPRIVSPASRAATFGAFAERLINNFVAAGEQREPAICDAASSLPVIEILDRVYQFSTHYSAKLGTV
jgi:predicted dehydrogenase